MQDWSLETYTLRHKRSETALPARWMEAFLPGSGLGGAGNHWNGQTWRWSEYEPQLRSRFEERYGRAAIPKDVPLQDWGMTYAEMRPYHELFEKLFGISGKAGNIDGRIQPGGNPFEAPRDDEFPQKPLETTEAGLIFKETASARLRAVPDAGRNSSGAYTNPDGMKLGACQYCGHCERFICEAQAKATPEVLLYPMLRKRKGFEMRLHCHVLGIDYDQRRRRAIGVRYVDLHDRTRIRAAGRRRGAGRLHDDQHASCCCSAASARPTTRSARRGVVGKNFCYQTGTGVSLFMKDRWINPFLATGSTQMTIDEFNNDNFDHAGLGFLGGAVISARHLWPADRHASRAARHAALGHRLEAGQRRLVRAFR